KRRTNDVKSSPYRLWKWVTFGVTLGLLGGAIATNRIAASKQSDLESAAKRSRLNGGPGTPSESFDKYKSLQSTRPTMSKTSGALFGVAGGTAVTSIILFIVDARYNKAQEEEEGKKKGSLSLSPIIGPTVGVTGAFDF